MTPPKSRAARASASSVGSAWYKAGKFRRVQAYRRRPLLQQRAGEGGARRRALDEDRVEHPWPPRRCGALDRDLGGGAPLAVEGAEVDEQHVGARGELSDLLGRHGHRRHGAHGEQHIGGESLGHRVGDAVDARRLGAQLRQHGGGGVGEFGSDRVRRPHLKLPPPA
jgi:hypothetical protein